jgi:hypothetical protein
MVKMHDTHPINTQNVHAFVSTTVAEMLTDIAFPLCAASNARFREPQ